MGSTYSHLIGIDRCMKLRAKTTVNIAADFICSEGE